MQYMYNGKNVTNESFTGTDGNSYPANWSRLASREQRDAIGIVENSDALPPTLGIEVPQSVSMSQARRALHKVDLLEKVDAAIKLMGAEAIIKWEYTPIVERNSPLVAVIQHLFGMNSKEIDNLFRLAILL